jgi:predicted RNA binding protein YcfA (HicA-like mRNA interferase family)
MKHFSGQDYVKAAKKAGLDVTNGKGDHAIVRGRSGRGMMVVPLHKELARGTEAAIAKWLSSLGIVLSLFILAAFAAGIL